MFAIIGIVVVFRLHRRRLPDGARQPEGAHSARRTDHHRRRRASARFWSPTRCISSKKLLAELAEYFGGSKFGKQTYIDTLKMMYDLLNKARKDGLMALEADVEEPQKSAVFAKNPAFLKNHHVCDFVCDSLRMAITGIDAFDLDQMLDLDLEVHHNDATAPTTALSTMADSLPGLGIVAAVLGRGHHHGRAGRTSRRNRTQSRRRAGRNISWNSVVLRIGGTARGQHDEGCRRRARIPLRDARADGFVPERHRSDHGGGSGAPRGSRARAAILQGTGAGLPARRSGGRRRNRNRGVVRIHHATMDKTRPIIILKKKGGHGGHHGGAWKVAYADFVTAMMALFIVLWLLNSSKQVQEAVGGYFKDPTGTSKKVGSNMVGAGENFVLTRDNMPQLKEQLQQAMKQMSDFERLKNHIEMTVTTEGLRIELSESATGTFFESGSAKLNERWIRASGNAGAGTWQTSQQAFDRRPHRLTAVCAIGVLRQLGTLRRPRECSAPGHAGERHSRRPDQPGTRICGPTLAQSRRLHSIPRTGVSR